MGVLAGLIFFIVILGANLVLFVQKPGPDDKGLRRRRLVWAGMAVASIIAWMLWLFLPWEQPVDDFAAQKNFAGIVLSRKGINNVRKFKDDTYMHGHSYYYFRADPREMNRLIGWLELEKSERIPANVSSLIEGAVTRNGWQFSWSTSQVYVAHYCNPDNVEGINYNFDLLLVSNGEGLFVTRGYLPATVTRTTDPSKCAPSRSTGQTNH